MHNRGIAGRASDPGGSGRPAVPHREASSMRRLLGAMLLGLAISATSTPARAQAPGRVGLYSGPYSIYGAPGYYGTTYGVPSYGMKRTYSEFSSPYGAGYAYGYAPTS